jgi:hypothetical protein
MRLISILLNNLLRYGDVEEIKCCTKTRRGRKETKERQKKGWTRERTEQINRRKDGKRTKKENEEKRGSDGRRKKGEKN